MEEVVFVIGSLSIVISMGLIVVGIVLAINFVTRKIREIKNRRNKK